MAAIGIDLGTTCVCVAFWRNGIVEVIANEQGDRTTPSVVAFTESERLIGESARNQACLNPRNTIFGTKRLIGRRYDDIGLQMDLRHFPYKIIQENGKPVILVEYKGEKKQFAPEEISAMLLFRMKEIAEAYLGMKVEAAVITVPAYFNDAQRHATKVAGIVAGLKVLRITNEPTAAALSYGLDKNLDSNVLIYDLGGGTFDVSVLSVGDSIYEVKSTTGNTRLGGEDFDNRMVAFFIEDFKKRYHMDITANPRSLRRLKAASERAKRFLTSASEAVVSVDSLFSGLDYSGTISRALFEELCSDLFKDTLKYVQQVLLDAKLHKSAINHVVLVGGSTRIPKVKSMLQDFFGNVPVIASINPDEAVASGAAIQAAVLFGEKHGNIENLLLIDVVPLSLGVETSRGVMLKIIDRNTAIPCSRTKDLTTLEDNQSSMTIEIFEGERSLTKDNNLLGVFDLNGIPPAPRGVAKVDITFEVDFNGILSVTAQDRITGNSERITIRHEHRLKPNDIGRMLAEANIFSSEDRENRLRLEARNQLEGYVYGVKHAMNTRSQILSPKETDFILEQCDQAMQWLDNNGDQSREVLESKMNDLMKKWSTILKKIYKPRNQAKRARTENYNADIEEIEPSIIEEIFSRL